MKKRIIFFVIILMMSFITAQTEKYYKLELEYDNGKINISSLDIQFEKEKIESKGLYIAEIIDYDDNLLNLTFFDVPNKIFWDGINPETEGIDDGGKMELNQTSFEIFVPYYENAKKIIIYDENLIEITKIDVRVYSEQEEIKEEIKIEQEKDKTGNLVESITKYWWILLMILIILSVILFYSIKKDKKE